MLGDQEGDIAPDEIAVQAGFIRLKNKSLLEV